MALVEDKQTYYLFPSPNFYANAMESFLNKGEPQSKRQGADFAAGGSQRLATQPAAPVKR